MKTTDKFIGSWRYGAIIALSLLGARAGTFNASFNDGKVPPGTSLVQDALVDSTGGVGDTGALKLTRAVNGQGGVFLIEDLDAGSPVYGFEATFMALVGGGTSTPADGWSFNFAPDIADGAPFGEWGSGNGITIGFDVYDNVDGDPNNDAGEAPAINVKVGGQTVASKRVPLSDLSTNGFVPMTIRVSPGGALDVVVNGKTHFSKLYFANYQPITGGRFAFGARTGGLNEKHYFDDIKIVTYTSPEIGIVESPKSQTVVEGTDAAFSVKLNNADNATIQWLKNGASVAGANTDSYTLANAGLADTGAKISARVTLDGKSVTSDEAVLKVVAIDLPATPLVSLDFNDGQVPANSSTFGSSYVGANGGVSDSGVLVLTEAQNDQNGSFLIEDPSGGAPVFGIAARFQVRAGGGSDVPADGFSFNFASDLPETSGEAENGGGTGLSVNFDVYDNGGGEAPAIALKYGGSVIQEVKVGASFLKTGDGFADVIVRLTPDGLFDLAWNGIVLFDRVNVPGFSSISAGRYGFYARTGGLNENHWVDDLKIYTYTSAPMRITRQPAASTVLVQHGAGFSVEVSLPEQATFQWYKNGTAIGGATQPSLSVASVALADDGAKYKVEVKGPGVTVFSDEVTLTVVNLTAPAAPQLSYDFNSGSLPAGAEVGGTAFVDSTGGVNDGGVLKVTIAENSQAGGFRSSAIAGGAQLLDINLAVDILAGGGSTPPADGFSLNIGGDVPLTANGDAENGAGTGLTIAFDTYDNGGGEAPSIDVRYGGQLVVSKKVPLSLINNADIFFATLLHVTQAGVLDLAFGETVVFHNLLIPGFAPINNAKVAIYARTGGYNANYFFDNIRVGAKVPDTIAITVEPQDALVLAGQPGTFEVQVSNPSGVSYQWFKNDVLIGGATSKTYTTPALATSDDGSRYSVQVKGPNNTLTSRSAVASILAAFDAGTSPAINVTFNDGLTPENSDVFGNAAVDSTGGVGGSGVLKLTLAENGQSGAWLFPTPSGVDSITDFVATWSMRVGGGTAVPADGFGFGLGSDIPDGTFGQEGVGTGISVGFDTYDNGAGEAPAIDVRYKGDTIATRKVNISVLETGDAFVTIGVRVSATGLLDLYYGKVAIFRGVQLPKYTPFAAGRFGFGAQTGGLNDNHWVDNVRIAVNSQPATSVLSVKSNGNGTVTVSWTGTGTLQMATAIGGSWADLPTAVTPYTTSSTPAAKFFRVKQ